MSVLQKLHIKSGVLNALVISYYYANNIVNIEQSKNVDMNIGID